MTNEWEQFDGISHTAVMKSTKVGDIIFAPSFNPPDSVEAMNCFVINTKRGYQEVHPGDYLRLDGPYWDLKSS